MAVTFNVAKFGLGTVRRRGCKTGFVTSAHLYLHNQSKTHSGPNQICFNNVPTHCINETITTLESLFS